MKLSFKKLTLDLDTQVYKMLLLNIIHNASFYVVVVVIEERDKKIEYI